MKRNKWTLFATAVLFCGLSAVSCDDDKPAGGNQEEPEVRVESVEWKSDLKDGKELELDDNSMNVANRMDILPANATNQTQTFSSSNTSVATISDQGQITPKALGTTTITVTVDEKTASFTLTVTEPYEEPEINVTDIDIPEPGIGIVVGESKSLSTLFTVLPENATDKSVSFESEDESVVTVSVSGSITGMKEGTGKVFVISNDDTTIRGEFNVTVSPYYGDYDRTDWTLSIAPIREVNDTNSNTTHVFDGITTTFFSIIKPGKSWEGSSNPTVANGGYMHFIVDMKTAKTVNYFRIRHRGVGGDLQLRFRKFTEIYGSNNGEDFTLIDKNIDVPWETEGEANVLTPNLSFEEATYRYIKFYCGTEECFNAVSGNTAQMAELYLGRAE